MIVTTVHRPELTDEERARRMEEIKQAAARLVLATEKTKKQIIGGKHEQHQDHPRALRGGSRKN